MNVSRSILKSLTGSFVAATAALGVRRLRRHAPRAQARVSDCTIAYPDFPAPIGIADSAYRLRVLGGALMHS